MYNNNIFSNEAIRSEINCSHPHTIVSFFDKTIVGNIHGSDVTKTQLYGRTLLKAFVAAAARAKQINGVTSCTDLQKPIVVQCVQTDGREFHFGVFQLNTLNLNSSNTTKNYWFHRDSIELFNDCSYKCGRPHLDGYNAEPFRILNAFYHSS